jgi:putative phosphoesterase
MRIGVFSDTHDNLTMIERALRVFEKEQVEVVLHLGDFVAPFALRRILGGLKVPLYGVFGNNDGEKILLKGILGDYLRDGPFLLKLGDYKVLLLHEFQQDLIEVFSTSSLRAVFFGHTHQVFLERRNGVLFFNPGECCGYLTGKGTLGICDLDKLEAKVIEL